VTSSEWESRCLSVNPFDGDYGGCGAKDSILSDRIVKLRKECECHTCAQMAKIGTRVRRRVEIYDGDFMRFAWCQKCCEAMASSDFMKFEKRIAIGDKKRNRS
jgi:hypothetical protein